jgi:hypothetical protein
LKRRRRKRKGKRNTPVLFAGFVQRRWRLLSSLRPSMFFFFFVVFDDEDDDEAFPFS